MKKLKFLFVMLIGILLVPCTVLAKDKDPVNVYFFYGNGCPHCAEAEEFFDSIEDELGDQFDIVSYETWYDTDNVDLMNEVADIRKEEPQGVPYIIIGNQSWDGYTSSYDDEIIDKIQSEYEKYTNEPNTEQTFQFLFEQLKRYDKDFGFEESKDFFLKLVDEMVEYQLNNNS